MSKIKKMLKSIAELRSVCPNGHHSVISLPDGTLVCQDCPWRSR